QQRALDGHSRLASDLRHLRGRNAGRSLPHVTEEAGIRRAGRSQPRRSGAQARDRRAHGQARHRDPVRLQHDVRLERQHHALPARQRLPRLQRGVEPAPEAVRRRKAAAAVHCSARLGTDRAAAGEAASGSGVMASHSVEKIGGTSMAAPSTLFDNVLIGGPRGAELYERIFGVSAYAGMTNLLLDHKKTGEPGVYALFVRSDPGWRDALDRVRDAMSKRNAAMFARGDSLTEANRFVRQRIDALRACLEDLDRLRAHGRFALKDQFATVREMLAGFGEAHSAHSTALLLRDRGVDAVFVDLTLWSEDDAVSLDRRILDALGSIDLSRQMPIVTGYAGCEGGMVRRYARGYSEMTFSRIAVLTKARRAIIHK